MEVSGQCTPWLLDAQEVTLVPAKQEAAWTAEPIWAFGRREKSLAPT
jgi:hypothetical protein